MTVRQRLQLVIDGLKLPTEGLCKSAAAEIDRLTPQWRDGDPPADTWVWREGMEDAVLTFRNQKGQICFWYGGDINGDPLSFTWDTARWAPRGRPES